MLGSWFTQKPNEEDTLGRVSSRTTPRPSFSSPTDKQAPRASTDKPPKRTFPTAYTTPHDAILADLQGTTQRLGPSDPLNYPAYIREEQVISPDLESLGPREDKLVSHVGKASQQNLAPNPSVPASQIASSPDLLLDPFDGMPLGVLIPHQDNPNSDDQWPSQVNLLGSPERGNSTNANPVGSEAVWSNLSHVLEIQSQISKMHLEMEGIGTAKGRDSKGKRHKTSAKPVPESSGGTSGMASQDPAVPPGLHHQPRKRAMSTVSTVSAPLDEGEGDEEGVNVPNEEAEKNRIREEEFANLATQFEGRKEAIRGIMGKLDDLSQALYKFHQLSPPTMDVFSPRNNSLGGTSPPKSTMSHQAPGEGEVKRIPVTQSTAPEAKHTYQPTEQNAVSSSSTMPAPPLGRVKSDTVVIGPVPQRPALQKKTIPTLMLNSMDLETHTHVMDSPASTMGSMKQLTEE